MAKRSKSDQLKSKLARSLDASKPKRAARSASHPSRSQTQASPDDSMSEPTDTLLIQSNVASADSIVMTSTMLAAGAGAIPLPGWDIAAVAGVQLKMLADLSKLYDVPFSKNLGKSAMGTLLGSLGPSYLARGSLGAVVKVLPGLGQFAGMVALPALSGGCTYALGKVFIAHYESGGTLLTFKPKEFSTRFAAEVKAGMKKVASVKI
jgi:uncharacterized protein (DUF697 family)